MVVNHLLLADDLCVWHQSQGRLPCYNLKLLSAKIVSNKEKILSFFPIHFVNNASSKSRMKIALDGSFFAGSSRRGYTLWPKLNRLPNFFALLHLWGSSSEVMGNYPSATINPWPTQDRNGDFDAWQGSIYGSNCLLGRAEFFSHARQIFWPDVQSFAKDRWSSTISVPLKVDHILSYGVCHWVSKCKNIYFWMVCRTVAILEWKKWGGHCGAKEEVGGANISDYLAWWFFIVLKIKLL